MVRKNHKGGCFGKFASAIKTGYTGLSVQEDGAGTKGKEMATDNKVYAFSPDMWCIRECAAGRKVE